MPEQQRLSEEEKREAHFAEARRSYAEALKHTANGLALKSKRLRHQQMKITKSVYLPRGFRVEGSSKDGFVITGASERFLEAIGKFEETGRKRLIKKWHHAQSRTASLHRERTHIVRKQARALHLARMYIKGVPYRCVEQSCHTDPKWEMVLSFISPLLFHEEFSYIAEKRRQDLPTIYKTLGTPPIVDDLEKWAKFANYPPPRPDAATPARLQER